MIRSVEERDKQAVLTLTVDQLISATLELFGDSSDRQQGIPSLIGATGSCAEVSVP